MKPDGVVTATGRFGRAYKGTGSSNRGVVVPYDFLDAAIGPS